MTTAVALGVNPACPRTHLAPRRLARARTREVARDRPPRRRGRRRRETSLGHRAEFGAERFVSSAEGLLRGGRRGAPQPLPGGRHERTRERLAPPLRRDRAARVRGSAGGAVPARTTNRSRSKRRVLFAAACARRDRARFGVGREAVPEGRRDAQRRGVRARKHESNVPVPGGRKHGCRHERERGHLPVPVARVRRGKRSSEAARRRRRSPAGCSTLLRRGEA